MELKYGHHRLKIAHGNWIVTLWILVALAYYLSSLTSSDDKSSTGFSEIFQQRRDEVLFVTAVYGTYEKSLKHPEPQSIPTRFVAFTDRDDLVDTPGWEVHVVKDPASYQSSTSPCGRNDLSNNKHPFNKAKFFKQQFHTLSILRGHRIVIWVDATVHIHNGSTAELIKDLVENHGRNLIVFEHYRGGLVEEEVKASQFPKYLSTTWAGHEQPIQNTTDQFLHYQMLGFRDKWWLNHSETPFGIVKREQYGLWVTCFVAYDMENPVSCTFLDTWWKHNVQFTTQDQVSFPFVAWKLKVFPFSLPSFEIKGDFNSNSLFKKLDHGLRR